MNTLTLSETVVRQDADGRFCLNDLHKASGSHQKHRPSRWLENQQAKDLIAELELEAGIPAIKTVKGHRATGTYVVKELVYAYAMWISPAFHIRVIRAYDAQPDGLHLTARRAAAYPVRKGVESSERGGLRTRQSCGFFVPGYGREGDGYNTRKGKKSTDRVRLSTSRPPRWGCVKAAPRVQKLTRETVMHTLTLSDVAVRQDADGRFCLNDLHKASGGQKKHQASDFLRLRQTQGLIAELTKPGIPGLTQSDAGIPASVTIKGGRNPRTYVVKELVYAYAMWISPAFHIRVIRAYDAAQAAEPTPPALPPPEVYAPASFPGFVTVPLCLEVPTDRRYLVITRRNGHTTVDQLADDVRVFTLADLDDLLRREGLALVPLTVAEALKLAARQLGAK